MNALLIAWNSIRLTLRTREAAQGNKNLNAIELTSLYDLSGKSREEMIFDKEKLLSVYDQTKDTEPMRSRR